MTDTAVVLGDFTFSRFEVPERIPFGGEQLLAIQQLTGGKRVVDAMGRSDMPLEWSGRFQGEGALDRARQLDAMRIAGQPLELTWSELSYTVVIRRLDCEFERFYQLPYRISCEVIEDLSAPVEASPEPDTDAMMADDMATADGLGEEIGDDGLSGALDTLQGAVSAVGGFLDAGAALLNPLAYAIGGAGRIINTLIAAGEGVFVDGSPFGGVVADGAVNQLADALLGQASASAQLAQLYELQTILGRMLTNLDAIGVSGTPITVAGGDLYRLAADAYGDASAWPTIAKANDLTDPLLTGIQDLTIPARPGAADGILRAD